MEWTIIPYWSINLFYVATLFFSDDREGVDRSAKRYLTCQLIAVLCFIVFPLRAIFDKPQTSGLTGFMFDALGSFDKPFNQAPSLHIALLVIIWDHWRARFDRLDALVLACLGHAYRPVGSDNVSASHYGHPDWRAPRPFCSVAVSRSIHHRPRRRPVETRRWKIGGFYAAGSLLFLALGIITMSVSPLSLFLLWPSLALALVAAAYFVLGVPVFQKRADGAVSFAAFWLLMPYRWGARINAWTWTRRLPPSALVMGNVHLGHVPSKSEMTGFGAVIDMTGRNACAKGGGC